MGWDLRPLPSRGRLRGEGLFTAVAPKPEHIAMPGPPDEALGLVTMRKQASKSIKPCPIDTTEKKELEVLELDSLVEEVY